MGHLKTQKLKVLREGTLIVAIDIGMDSHRGYCTSTNGDSMKPFKFDNSKGGFDKLWEMAMIGKNRFKCDEVIIGYESTGPYSEPLVHYLMQKPVKIVQVNPMHTKRVKEINDNSPLKTDDKDPRVIADIIKIGHSLSLVVPEGDAAELRRLNNIRERHIKNRTAYLNQMQQLIFIIFPEFRKVIKDISSKTGIYILKKYETPGNISHLDIEELGREISKISRGKFKAEQAEALINLAKETVGIKEGLMGLRMDIRHILAQLEVTECFITEVEEEIERVLQRIPYSSKLLSIKGLGVITVGGLIGEVGDFNKFKTQSEIIKLAGLDIYEISSGYKRGQRRITKRGRSVLRKILYFAAIQTVRKSGIMHEYYMGLVGRGMKKIKALVAVSRKLLSVIYAIVRDNSEYEYRGINQATAREVIRKAA